MNLLLSLALAVFAAEKASDRPLPPPPPLSELNYVDGNSVTKLYVTKEGAEPKTWYASFTLADGKVMSPKDVFSTPASKARPAWPGSVTLGDMMVPLKGGYMFQLIVFNDGGRGMWAAMQATEDKKDRICLAPLLWWGISEGEAYKACVANKL